MDNVDKLSFESKRRLRSRFTLKEGQTVTTKFDNSVDLGLIYFLLQMLLARAVSLVVCPNQKMWVKPTCVRDLMHKYVPVNDKNLFFLVRLGNKNLFLFLTFLIGF